MRCCTLPGELRVSGCRIKQLWISYCKTEIPHGNSEQSAPSATVQSLVGLSVAGGGFSPMLPVCHLNYVCVPSLISLFPNERQRWDSKVLLVCLLFKHSKFAMQELERFELDLCMVSTGAKVEVSSSLSQTAILPPRPLNKEWHSLCTASAWVKSHYHLHFLKSSSPPYLCFLFLTFKKWGHGTGLWSQGPWRIINTSNEEHNFTRTRSLLNSLILFIIGN